MEEPTTLLHTGSNVEIRLPGAFREEALTQPSDGPLPRRWISGDGSSLLLLVADRSRQPGYGLLQYSPGPRTQCWAIVAGAPARVVRYAAVRGMAPFDTLYVANLDAELGPDRFLFSAVIARSPARREALLSAVRDLRLLDPQQSP